MSLKQPVGQKLLTNVAVVRLKKGGCKFEVACYKNKVQNWRAGIEKDIDEVLQINQVFANVAKGIKAKPADMEKAFHTTDQDALCRLILETGELQLSDKEREHNLDQLFRDVVHIIAEKCVNPQTQRPVTIGVVERMMRESHISLSMHQTAKVQALEIIKTLEAKFPIQRAAMRIRISIKGREVDEAMVKVKLQPLVFQFQPSTDSSTLTALIAPGKYRQIDTLVNRDLPGCSIEVLSISVQEAGEQNLESMHTSTHHHNSNNSGSMLVSDSIDASIIIVTDPSSAAAAAMSQGSTTTTTASSSTTTSSSAAAAAPTAKKLGCNSCGGVTFLTPQHHRDHFKTEWHRFNLKRKVEGLEFVDQSTYDQLVLLEPVPSSKDFY